MFAKEASVCQKKYLLGENLCSALMVVFHKSDLRPWLILEVKTIAATLILMTYVIILLHYVLVHEMAVL